MSQESDVCYTTSMYDIQTQFIPDEIDLFYFTTWIITHNNNAIEQNIDVSTFDILSVKKPIHANAEGCPWRDAAGSICKYLKGMRGSRTPIPYIFLF